MSHFPKFHALMRVHTVPTEEDGSTWLQLFFDLVYVAILVELGDQLANNLNLLGLAEFIIIFIPVWWSWQEFVEYGTHYPVDDIGQRILTVLYMAVMLLMAFEIHSLAEIGATTFIVTFGLSKFILALMYGRAWIYYPTYRHLTSIRAAAYIVVGILWITLALFAPTNLWLFAVPIVLGALVPWFIRLSHGLTNRSDLPEPTIKYHFTLHRFGELTIIVLGEFFIKLVVSSSGRELTAVNYLIGGGLLAISVSLWWLYFDHLEHADLSQVGTRIRVWIYSHFPFVMAITAYGVVGNKIFAVTPRAPLDDSKRLLFTIALAVALLTFGALEWASKEKDEPLSRRPQPWLRLGSAAALLALGFFGESLNVGWLVALTVSVFLVQVGFDVHRRLQRPEPDVVASPGANLNRV
jgi:low temperature requirement protein LtrA